MKHALHKRLVEEFNLRNTPPNTRKTYTHCIERFERHFDRSAATLGRAEVRQFLLHLVEHEKLSPITHNVYAAALHFLYTHVLRRPRVTADIGRRKVPRTLPEVLTAGEVERLLEAMPSPTYRVLGMLCFGAGLRISEALGLRVEAIDSAAGVLHVRNAKRNRDRDVMLGPQMLGELRRYWRWRRPSGPELFPGRDGIGTTLTRAAVSKAVKKALTVAGLGGRRITPHTLRHSFATWMLEHGTDLRTLQVLLGHGAIQSTTRYLHISTARIKSLAGPIEQLRLPLPTATAAPAAARAAAAVPTTS